MNHLLERIEQIGIVPVIKLDHPTRDSSFLAKVLCQGGVPVAEITFRAAGATDAIHIMKQTCPDMIVGAGTVLTTAQVDEACTAGAQFIVTPGLDPQLVTYCLDKNIIILPGCTTPTDYHTAFKLGLKVLKFFPAEQSGGIAKIKAMSAPFPMFKIMPTGGISPKNLKDYIQCPVVTACGGSYMVTSDLIEGQKWQEITNLCKESITIIQQARSLCL